jgi:hypothetical protein
MVNGNVTNTSMGKVWTLRINVTNALNVGLTLNQFNLSPSAEMYIFNDAKTALKSGIKKEHFTISDTISISSVTGDAITIYIIEINNFDNFQSSILIGSLIAGYRTIEDVGDDDSGALLRAPTINCIPDILCYPQHMESARAVA